MMILQQQNYRLHHSVVYHRTTVVWLNYVHFRLCSSFFFFLFFIFFFFFFFFFFG